MRYYAHYGHTEFILCLGYRGDLVREYFLNYNEALSNDFTLDRGCRRVELHSRDLDSWKITFVDTGLDSSIGQRLLRVRNYLRGDPIFLANYSDALSNLPLDEHLQSFMTRHDLVASFAAVRSTASFHVIQSDQNAIVTRISSAHDEDLWINGGFFIFRGDIFDHIHEGEELVEAPFSRLIGQRKLSAYKWRGFWHAMDTLKDKLILDQMEASGVCEWKVWQRHLGARSGYTSCAVKRLSLTGNDDERRCSGQ